MRPNLVFTIPKPEQHTIFSTNVMNSGGGAVGAAAAMVMMRSPFTASQWQELEHQALIFKYMMAGLPVPPDLLLPIHSISHVFHHPSMGYCSFYGKKVDPEPGRCRRTDGKKWRCSKDAYPDSKYCEHHMHRGRNRSRKPVESQSMSRSSSTVTSLIVTGSSGGTGSFQNLPLHAFGNPQATTSIINQSNYLDSIPYGIPSKDYRYVQGLKPEVGKHSFISGASGSNRDPQMDSSRVSSHSQSKLSENSIMQNDYHQHSFFGSEFGSGELTKQEGQSFRPFFDEWPKARESGSGLDDERSNQNSFSTTQLSISIPMASSDFSATNSQSPHEN